MPNQNQIKKSKTRFIDNFVFLIFILFTARASWIVAEDWFILSVFSITFLIFIIRKMQFDKIIIYIVLAWILINIASNFHNDTPFNFNTFAGAIMKIITSYFILKIMGVTFYWKLEKIIYFLTAISIPLFLLQLIALTTFKSLSPYLNALTGYEQKELGGWYIVIYNCNGLAFDRNSGFMSEPGAFAMIIIFGILIHLYLTDFKPNLLRIVIYLIAMTTTFSTMGFIVILLVFTAFIIQKKKFSYFIFLVPLMIYLILVMKDFSFILPELKQHIESSTLSTTRNYIGGTSREKFNRLGFINLVILDSFKWPFGNGVLESQSIKSYFGKDIIGGSAFGHLLLMWGWLGIGFWIWLTYLFFKRISIRYNQFIVNGLSALSMLLAISSNPIPKSPLIYVIVLSPFMFFKK